MKIIEKKHRLQDEYYIGQIIAAITIRTASRKINLTDIPTFNLLKDELYKSSKEEKCSFDLFLCMPDHIHLIIRGKENESDIKKCLKLFKQYTGYLYSKKHGLKLWKKDYYDRIIRNRRELKNHIRYILLNPVKAELIDDWRNYKFMVSQVYDLEDFRL